jgi:EAL and modified HD-GYP domain-containing signal transduction protein
MFTFKNNLLGEIEQTESNEDLEVLLTRLAIVDTKGEVKAYELVFQAEELQHQGRSATATVIVHTLSVCGIEAVLGSHLGFIAVSDEMLLDTAIELLPARRVVLVIRDDTFAVTDELVQRCIALKKMGFKLAMDGFVYRPELRLVLTLLDYIKIDLSLTAIDQLSALANQIQKISKASLLASRVDTKVEFLSCKAMGFSLFQGSFFTKAVIVKGRKPHRQQIALMKIISLIQADADFGKIEPLFKQNPDLILGLLQLVNSVGVGFGGGRQKISSIRQAMLVIGQRKLERWLQLLLYSTAESGFNSGLLQLVVTRARMMELLARHIESSHPSISEQAFMVGMLSLADALLNIPLDEIFVQLSLTENLSNAVLHHQGQLGQLLRLVKLVEVGNFEEANPLIHGLYLSSKDFSAIQAKAMQWANELKN